MPLLTSYARNVGNNLFNNMISALGTKVHWPNARVTMQSPGVPYLGRWLCKGCRHMPLIPGEREKAFVRLKEEIAKSARGKLCTTSADSRGPSLSASILTVPPSQDVLQIMSQHRNAEESNHPPPLLREGYLSSDKGRPPQRATLRADSLSVREHQIRSRKDLPMVSSKSRILRLAQR